MITKELIDIDIADLTFSVIDTETTGMNAKYNRIMDIGIVTVKNGKIIDKWEALIDPEQTIPFWITKYTNLRNHHVKGKPTFDFFANEIFDRIKGSVFVGHNVNFDYSFLREEFLRYDLVLNMPKLCTVQLGRKLLPQLANAHLDAISDHYNIKISARHRALPDAEATAVILNNFINIAKQKYFARNFFDLERLQKIRVDKELLKVVDDSML